MKRDQTFRRRHVDRGVHREDDLPGGGEYVALQRLREGLQVEDRSEEPRADQPLGTDALISV